MRLSTDRRLLGLVAAFALAAGCDNKPKGTGGGTSGPAAAGTTAGLAAGGQTFRQFAESFLKELGEGKVGPDKLTANFKKKLAGPGKDADAAAAEYLAQFKGATFVIPEEGKVGNGATAFRGRAKLPDRSTSVSMRVVQGPAGYLIDWLHVSDRQGSEIKTPTDPDLAAAQDAARDFIDLVLGGGARQAHALMAPAWRKKLSPAGSQDERQGYDYGPGFLDGVLRSWKRDFLGYTIASAELGPNKDTATFAANMDSGGSKTPYVVKAVKDKATGEWLVDDFDKQQ
jgi:hypothetical protein